jgi:hypothetical protein
MVDTYAMFDVDGTWTPAGVGDRLIVRNNSPRSSRRGIQTTVNNLDLELATIDVLVHAGAVKQPDIEAGSGNSALIGKDWEIKEIRISGAAAATYTYHFSSP